MIIRVKHLVNPVENCLIFAVVKENPISYYKNDGRVSQLIDTLHRIAYQSIRRDELGIDDVGTIKLAYMPKWRVGDTLHWSK